MAQALGEDLVQPCELQDDSSSLGSDSELSGPGPYRQADRYGFIGGSSAEPGPGHPPADLIRQREMKWVEMTSHWEKTMSRRYKKVKMQCRKGIPSALRARCWPLLCGAHVCQKNSPGTYQGAEAWADAARGWEGMPRGLAPNGVFWHRQQGLLQVLKAYTLYRPEQGYCQAQGPVAAVLLMHLPPEEAFWCLVQICEVYLPGYYGPHMVRGWDAARGYRGRGWAGGWRPGDPGDRGWALGVEVQVGVGPLLYLPEWFLCLFARSLPFPTVLRVWDAFLSEGEGLGRRVAAWGLRGQRLGFGSGGADGCGRRRPCSWTPRCSWLCCGGCSRACTSTCSRWASGPCSTCPSGSCASSPAPCPSPQCCVSGTPSSARVSGVAGWAGGGRGRCAQGWEPWGARCSPSKHASCALPRLPLPILALGLGAPRVMAPCPAPGRQPSPWPHITTVVNGGSCPL
uniref:TBC1 domain family member 10C n=1 Tax=Equus asinus asinus TaxID=83772 RepID=A0A8C4LAL4_EQUAS